MERTEFLIVGQGLAGTVLAWTLYLNGADIRIIDRDEGAYCSQVAGGMINPISPRLPTKAWQAEVHFPHAEAFYRTIEERTNKNFYHPRTIHRPFKDPSEKERWQANAKKKGFDRFLWPNPPDELPGIRMDPDLGAASFQGAFLDLPAFLGASSYKFKQEGLIQRKDLEPKRLIERKDGWEYEGIFAERLILCQGTAMQKGPFFDDLPLRPNKGEILTLRMPDFSEKFILNRGFYTIPIGGGKVLLGATYDHEDLDPKPTKTRRKELLERMEEWVGSPYEVLEQKAGFRPTTPDTKPYVGFHPQKKRAAIFNGMGSKGVSLAPFWAKKLTEKLLSRNEEDPDPLVAPERFRSNEKAS